GLIGLASAYGLAGGGFELLSITPLWIVFGIAFILMVIRWVIFFYWRRTVDGWIGAVEGITAWGEALERSLQSDKGVMEEST
ncbi:MAG: hypothetical protein ACXACA_03295, partial [Candidatus Ranarchaeia archaeon]